MQFVDCNFREVSLCIREFLIAKDGTQFARAIGLSRFEKIIYEAIFHTGNQEREREWRDRFTAHGQSTYGWAFWLSAFWPA
jgi:hypothetical protein